MKFWQLLSIFRDEEYILKDVLEGEMLRHFLNINSIIRQQQRDILDAEVDNEALKKVCRRSNKVVYLSEGEGKLYSYQTDEHDQKIPILKAIDLFNHNSLEEVFEKSQSSVTE